MVSQSPLALQEAFSFLSLWHGGTLMNFQPKKKPTTWPSAFLRSQTGSPLAPFSFAAPAEEEDNKGEFRFSHD